MQSQLKISLIECSMFSSPRSCEEQAYKFLTVYPSRSTQYYLFLSEEKSSALANTERFSNQSVSIWSPLDQMCMCCSYKSGCIFYSWNQPIVIFWFVCSALVSVGNVCSPQVSTSLLPLQCCFSAQETVQVILDAEEICFGSSRVPLFPALHELSLLLPGDTKKQKVTGRNLL